MNNQIGQKGQYENEDGEYEDCIILSCAIGNYNYVLIELDGIRGYCSDNLIEEV
jgi:hypothetical protein